MAFCRLQDDQLAVVSVDCLKIIGKLKKLTLKLFLLFQPADVFKLKNITAFLEESEPRLSQCHEFRDDLDQQHLFSRAASGIAINKNLVLPSALLVIARIWICLTGV